MVPAHIQLGLLIRKGTQAVTARSTGHTQRWHMHCSGTPETAYRALQRTANKWKAAGRVAFSRPAFDLNTLKLDCLLLAMACRHDHVCIRHLREGWRSVSSSV